MGDPQRLSLCEGVEPEANAGRKMRILILNVTLDIWTSI